MSEPIAHPSSHRRVGRGRDGSSSDTKDPEPLGFGAKKKGNEGWNGTPHGRGAHLNTAEGVAARTLLPSGDQAKKVTPPPPNHCSWTQFSVDTSHTCRRGRGGRGGGGERHRHLTAERVVSAASGAFLHGLGNTD